jgi:alkanesulfonate monooxygenase SsuD/methylene tetrahydromethanopterin reductase-like flavin-dependent oxidoreductase (luciferase family)
MSAAVEVGIRVPHDQFAAGADALAAFGAAVDASELDRVWLGDHVSFKGGQGYDGLLGAMALAAVTRRITLQTAIYLLPLRHPVPVARQVAGIAELAPGRFVLGVGVGGDDPSELVNCGVDPKTRGRRTDESLALVRRLLSGETLDHRGDAFELEGASIAPTPDPRVPVVVGGRSPAALRRTARLGDGWLGLWVTPERFAAGVATVTEQAEAAGRGAVAWQHGLLAWCGFGASRAAARRALAPAMERLYQMPFDRFERYSPCGDPDDVAAELAPYVAAGATSILLAAAATDPEEVVAGGVRVRALLRSRS